MRAVQAGRMVFPSHSVTAREYAKRNLVSIHARTDRLKAIAGHIDLEARSIETGADDPLSLIAPEAATELAGVIPESSEWLLLRDYEEGTRARSILFLFRGDELECVVKLRRCQSEGAPLKSEARVLKYLEERSVGEVPRVVGQAETHDFEVLILSPLRGAPLQISMQRSFAPRRSHRSHLARVGSWLGRFHVQTTTSEDRADEADVVVHGDLWPRNILFDGNDIVGVVDWERGAIKGRRWIDLFTFPLLFATQSPSWFQDDPLTRFESAFTGDSFESRAVRRYFDEYTKETGIGLEQLRPRFDEFLDTDGTMGKERHAWHQELPWTAMRERMASARRTVFSG